MRERGEEKDRERRERETNEVVFGDVIVVPHSELNHTRADVTDMKCERLVPPRIERVFHHLHSRERERERERKRKREVRERNITIDVE